MKQITWVIFLMVVATMGCAATSPVDVSVDREVNPYLDVTNQVWEEYLTLESYEINYPNLTVHFSFANTTDYRPQNLMLITKMDMVNKNGMTEKGFGHPHDYYLINDGNRIEKTTYEFDIEFDVSGGLSYDLYVYGLFGPTSLYDPLESQFVYEQTNDPYDYADNVLCKAKLNGQFEVIPLVGKYPAMSGNGEWVCAPNISTGSLQILEIATGDVETVTPMYPVRYALMDYSGELCVYQYGESQHPYRNYIGLYNTSTGENRIVEGSDDGSNVIVAKSAHISGNGEWLVYNLCENLFNGEAWNLWLYHIPTGDKTQLTFYPPGEILIGIPGDEAWPEGINWDGSDIIYRHGYFTEVGGGFAPGSLPRYDYGPKSGQIIPNLDGWGVSYMMVYDAANYNRAADIHTSIWTSDGDDYLLDAALPWGGDWAYVLYSPSQLTVVDLHVYRANIVTGEIQSVWLDGGNQNGITCTGDGLYTAWFDTWGSSGIHGFSSANGYIGKIIQTGMWPNAGI